MKKEKTAAEPVRIVDVDESCENCFCTCLEEWSEEMKEAGDLKQNYYRSMKDKGLGAKMARNSRGEHVGMIQYIPAEYAPLEGEGFYHIFCTWVHAYRGKGVGDQRRKGIGKALLAAAEEEIHSRGASGISAWGITLPFWMRAAWYGKQGFRKADKNSVARLMWKPFSEGAETPRWSRPAEELTHPSRDGAMPVVSVINGICPAMNVAHQRMRRLAEEFGGRLNYQEYSSVTPEEIKRWGIMDGLYINGKAVNLGPPPSTDKLRKILEKELRRYKPD